MNRRLFLLFFVCCFIYPSYNCAMQLSSSKQKKKINRQETVQLSVVSTIMLPRSLIGIKSSTHGRIGILDCQEYTLWDYHNGEIISSKRAIVESKTDICFHPIHDKVFVCGDQKSKYMNKRHAFFIRYDYGGDGTGGKAFYYPNYEISSGLFSREESILFMADKNKLIFYDYEKNTESCEALKQNIGTLFSSPFHDQSYFLCSGDSQKKIYKI